MTGTAAVPPPRDLRLFILAAAIVIPVQIAGTLILAQLVLKNLPNTDYDACYRPAAASLLAGQGPLVEGKLLTIYPIGYPAVCAGVMAVSSATGLPETPLHMALNIACYLLALGGLFKIALEAGDRRTAVASVLLMGVFPHPFFILRGAYPQPFCWGLEAWAIWCVVRGCRSGGRGWFAGSGLLLGAAALLRPSVFAVWVALALYVALFGRLAWGRRVQALACMAIVFGLVLVPWTLYVHSTTGEWVFISSQANVALKGSWTAGYVTGRGHLQALVDAPLGHSLELLKRAGLAWYRTWSGAHQLSGFVILSPYLLLTVIGFVAALRDKRWRWFGGLGLAVVLLVWVTSTLTFYMVRLSVTGIVLAGFIPGLGLVTVLTKLRLCRPASAEPGTPNTDGARAGGDRT